MWFVLLLLAGLVFGIDLNSIKNESLNYATQGRTIGRDAKSRAENIVCIKGGADCSYQGQDYKSFGQESQARQKYLNQANDPNSALGQALSNIWSTSDIKSTLFYQKAHELYQCAEVSPDGKCTKYVGESYYGECQTVQQCISQTTKQTYAEYMCYIDAQGQVTAGETKHLCYVYNQIEPTVKEKEYVCHVVNTESIRTCNKDLQLSWGKCNINPFKFTGTVVGNYAGGYCSATITGQDNKLIFSGCMNGTIYAPSNVSFSGSVTVTLGGTTYHVALFGKGDRIEIRRCVPVWWGHVNCNVQVYGEISVSGTSVSGGIIFGCFAYTGCHTLIGVDHGIGYYTNPIPILSFSGNQLYKCSLDNQTYASKSECYQNCYTQQVQDCQVQ